MQGPKLSPKLKFINFNWLGRWVGILFLVWLVFGKTSFTSSKVIWSKGILLFIFPSSFSYRSSLVFGRDKNLAQLFTPSFLSASTRHYIYPLAQEPSGHSTSSQSLLPSQPSLHWPCYKPSQWQVDSQLEWPMWKWGSHSGSQGVSNGFWFWGLISLKATQSTSVKAGFHPTMFRSITNPSGPEFMVESVSWSFFLFGFLTKHSFLCC